MDFLNIAGKTYLVTGVANKKSIAYFTAKKLIEFGAKVIFSAQSSVQQKKILKLFPEPFIVICDVEKSEDIKKCAKKIRESGDKLSGLLHSIAFANYSEGIKPFHETKLEDYLQATHISSFSLVQLVNSLRDSLLSDASIVTLSISNTRATSYGYMGPIKASLNATVDFLAKSLSEFSKMRVNAVCSGPLKTSASAGIPGYINNYLYAEQLTLRKDALKTDEVANTACFLLSPRSSGINAAGIVVDGGMSCNHFDQKIVNSAMENMS